MQQLLESIAETIADYRNDDDIPPMNPDHIKKWINQFEEPVREPILEEINHVFKKTYYSKAKIKQCLTSYLKNEKLTEGNPASFWKNCFFLSKGNQLNGVRGNSQKDMLNMFDELLKAEFGYSIHDCGKGIVNQYIYLDDISFTGGHLENDLGYWIENHAPDNAKLRIIFIAYHTQAEFIIDKFIEETEEKTGKNIEQKWYGKKVENRKSEANRSDVLRPLKDMLSPISDYAKSLGYPERQLVARTQENIGISEFFSTPVGRNLLEKEFLKTGVKIRDMCNYLKNSARPLGYMTYKTLGLGFGSLLVTYRNCPNNCPLVFWVGDPWYPLFPREIN